MKRVTLLLTLLVIATVFVCSPLKAAPPKIGYRNSSVTRVLVQYFAMFLRTGNAGYVRVEPILISAVDSDPKLGGDADDYGHGKGDGKDSDGVDIGGLNGPIITGGNASVE